MKSFQHRGCVITIKEGNLVEEKVDAIVCPANSFNHMRGGVAAVIRNHGGDIIEQEAMAKAPVSVGKAVITTGGQLEAEYVIHAPTMTLPVQKTDTEAVRKAVRAALRCADQQHLHSISFPGMGTGTGWVSYDDAAYAMLDETKRYLDEEKGSLGIIGFVAYSQTFYRILNKTAQNLFSSE